MNCNYCVYKNLKERAKKENNAFITTPLMGGVEIYLVPPNEKFNQHIHFRAFLCAMPDYCECNFNERIYSWD